VKLDMVEVVEKARRWLRPARLFGEVSALLGQRVQ
jgi:hypothetical protein